jgi:Tol biopolymer transport system component
MSVDIGTRLGSLEIMALLGKGGMGEVYRARDTKLKREVAIKILPEQFSRDRDRVSRFQREAEVLASLNQPNIAAIYDLQEADGAQFLVLELVEGETLADRIARGPVPVEEALNIAKSICEALEAAHEKGIVHRDLKPANVKITPEGNVKVLDFGLAKAMEGVPTSSTLSHSPTMLSATMSGAIIGTAAYMSPEQARGRTVDKRADIWAFGCVLYEMLTRKQAFRGEDVTDILTSIVKGEPDWEALPADVPANIRTLLRRCFQKDLKKRTRDAGDVGIEIDETLSAPARPASDSPATIPVLGRGGFFVAIGSLLLVGLVTGFVVWHWKPVPPGPVSRFTITLPRGQRLAGLDGTAITFSPDGKRFAYVATTGGPQRLYLRDMDSLEVKPLVGTEGAVSPFFSPDGQWVGFFTIDKLKKISTSGGPPVTLARVSEFGRGGSWGTDGNIVFASRFDSELSLVSAAGGGAVQSITNVDRSKGEGSHRWPHHLPGTSALLFTVGTGGSWDDARIEIFNPKAGERRVLIEGGSDARYVLTRHLVFVRAGTLMAVPFDLQRLEVRGSPAPFVEGVLPSPDKTGSAHATISDSGSLAYISGDARVSERTLVWVDRKGTQELLPLPPQSYRRPRVSPDGRRVTLDIDQGNKQDVWIYELLRGTLTRLTSRGSNFFPEWSSDGKKVTFGSDTAGAEGVFWKNADGSGSEEPVWTSPNKELGSGLPSSWSPDGQILMMTEFDPGTGLDILTFSLKTRQSRPFLRTPFNEGNPAFSRDGLWIAYQSDESGRDEIYVQPFPGPGSKVQVSTEGGTEPAWSRDGRELFYRDGDKMRAVETKTKPTFQASKPQVLFERPYLSNFVLSYDVSSDDRRFLMIKENEQVTSATTVNVVLNWLRELQERVPVK